MTVRTYTVQLIRTVQQIKEVVVEATSMEEAEAMTLASHPTPAFDSDWEEDSSWVISFASPPTDTQVNDAWEM